MTTETPRHLRHEVTVTPTMRDAAARAGIDATRDDAVLRWRHERVCRLRASRIACLERAVVARFEGERDDETRDADDDVDHNEDAPRRAHVWGAPEVDDLDDLPDVLTVRWRAEVM